MDTWDYRPDPKCLVWPSGSNPAHWPPHPWDALHPPLLFPPCRQEGGTMLPPITTALKPAPPHGAILPPRPAPLQAPLEHQKPGQTPTLLVRNPHPPGGARCLWGLLGLGEVPVQTHRLAHLGGPVQGAQSNGHTGHKEVVASFLSFWVSHVPEPATQRACMPQSPAAGFPGAGSARGTWEWPAAHKYFYINTAAAIPRKQAERKGPRA